MQNNLMNRLAAFQNAVAADPRSVTAHRNLGLTWDQMGQAQRAVSALEKAMRLAPQDVSTLASLASVYNKTEQFESAAKACQAALDVDPKHVGALGNLGSALRHLQRYDDAAAAYERAIEVAPDAAALWMNLGNLKLDTEELDAACKAFENAIKIEPKNADAYANLGEAYRRLGQGDLSIAALQTALKHDPIHVLAHLNLGISLSQFGFLEEAVAVFVRALPISGEDPKVLSYLGACLESLGEVDKAIRALRRAIAKPQGGDEALIKLATFPVGTLTKDIVEELESAAARLPEHLAASSFAPFVQAGYLRHVGDIDASFAQLRQANRLEIADKGDVLATNEANCAKTLERVRAWQPQATQTQTIGLTPLFILGPSRSGKSTLEQVLDASPEVARFFEGVWAGGYRFSAMAPDGGHVPPQRLENCFAARFQRHLADSGVRFGVYTNPHLIMSIDFLFDLVPDARFIAVKRDKIDVAAEIFAQHYSKGNFYSYDPAYLMRYLDWYDAMLDAVNEKVAGRIMTVTSQDMVEDLPNTLEKVSAHLGVAIAAEGLRSPTFVARPSIYRDHFQELLSIQAT